MSRRLILMAAAISLTITTNAQKGNIGFVYPAGAQRGTSVEITVGGQNLSRATGIIISGEGVSGELIPTPKSQQKKKRSKKNKLPKRRKIRFARARDILRKTSC